MVSRSRIGKTARHIFLVGLSLLACSAAPARGQLFEEDEVESVTKVSELLRQVQFRVVGGRVVADCARQGLSLTTETRDLAGGRWERLTLDMSNDAPGLRYERKTAQDEVVIELSDGDHLIIRRVSKASSSSFEFEQPPTGNSTLSIEADGRQRLVQAATLWHLLLIEPEVGQKQIVPLLEMLRPSWQLAAKASTIETALLRWAESQRQVDRVRLARLVQGLGDSHYFNRRAATRELSAIGEPARCIWRPSAGRTWTPNNGSASRLCCRPCRATARTPQTAAWPGWSAICGSGWRCWRGTI